MRRHVNNLRAEALADQVQAAIREGDEIPAGYICAAAARTLRTDQIKNPALREATKRLLDSWAERYGVDRPEENNV